MQRIFRIFVLISMIQLTACTPMEKADLIIKNANIYTVDQNFSKAEAIAIKDGKILAIGTSDAITSKYEASQVYDLDGKPVYPGFIDAHCHFLGYGVGLLRRADLVGTTSFEDVIEKVKAHHEKFPEAFWIEGRGWDQNDWEVKEFPTKAKLDEAFPDNPVYLTRIDGHAALVNSKALELAGIDASTKIDGGDVILKDGQPTGVLIDNAMELVSAIIPEPSDEAVAAALKAAEKNCFEVGLTGVHDAGLPKREVKIIDSLQKAGELSMPMYVMLSPSKENLETYVENGPYKTDRLNVRSIKLYADGALGSRGAKMIEDYSDDHGNSGLILTPPDTIRMICRKAIENGYQINTHAIGDSANRLMLELYGEHLKGQNDKRWRIEHVQIISPEDFKKFNQYSIVPSAQPTHATSDMYWAEDRVGHERIKGGYAYKDLLAQTGWIPLGTDFPIEHINPMYTFYAAVERKDQKGWPEDGFNPENALSREETLKGMTIWAAMAAFEENEKGSLEPGKYADFVVLEKDIMEIPGNELYDVKVLKTFLRGEEVFSR
jgi:predicted amidohydrolase YtcJ